MAKSKTKKKSAPVKKLGRAQPDTGEVVLKIGMGAVVALIIMTGAVYGVAAYKPAARESSFYEIFQYLPALVGAAGSYSVRLAKNLLGGERSDLFYAVAASAAYALALSLVFALVMLFS